VDPSLVARAARVAEGVPGALNWSQGVPSRGVPLARSESARRDDTAVATQTSTRVNEWKPTW
jgi:hypothetical protein